MKKLLYLLALWPSILLAQTPIKISELPAAGSLGGTEIVLGVQSGSNKKISINQIRAYSIGGMVPDNRTINSYPLTSNINLVYSDVGAQPVNANLTTVAAHGNALQILRTNSAGTLVEWVDPGSTDFVPITRTVNGHALSTNVTIAKVDIADLTNVDNTSDANKPVSTATQTALDLKQNLTITTNSITGAGTLVGTDIGKLHYVSGTSADYTVVLPTSVGNAGKSITFTALPTLTKIVTIDANSNETINGLLVRAISSSGGFTLISDGANWFVVNETPSVIPFVPTAVGVIALSSPTCWYSLVGKRLIVNYCGVGTSNGTTYTLSLPSGMTSNSNAETLARVQNNSGILPGPGVSQISIGSTIIGCYTSPGGGAWSSTGTKFSQFQLTIEIQ